MNNSDSDTANPASMHSEANYGMSMDAGKLPVADIQALIHDLKVRNAELKRQNESLVNSQKDLLAAQNHSLSLFNFMPIACLALNFDGIIQKANPAAESLLGIGSENLFGRKFGEFIFLTDREGYYIFLKDILSHHHAKSIKLKISRSNCKAVIHECQGLKYCDCSPESCTHNDDFIYAECHGINCKTKKNGEILYLSILNVTGASKTNDITACLNEKLEQKVFHQTKALTDINQELDKKITQLQSYKRQVLEREEKLNSIFNAALEGIITIYTSGIIVSVNKAVETIFGYREDEIVNCNINKLILLPQPQYRPYQQNNAPGMGLFSMIGKIKEVTGLRKDHSTVPLDISIAKFSVDGSNYLTCIVRDVSPRKLREQRDQEHLDELAYVTRLGLMGEMASGIAHEVNQPLTAITSYSQVCLNLLRYENYDEALLKDILHKTSQQALKAGQIIHRMRDFVKGKKLQHSSIDMNELIYDAVSLCEAYLKQNGVQLRLNLKKRLSPVCADRIQIEQVVLNLIRNGVDALSNLPRLMPRNLSIQTAINGDNDIEIRIKDNGSGIDIAEQKKILTPFYTTKPDGMGMGLSICRSIIEAHEGTLRFNSQPGRGTTFYFTIPMRRKVDAI